MTKGGGRMCSTGSGLHYALESGEEWLERVS